MFKNPGQKLRRLAIIIFIIVLLGFIAGDVLLMNAAGESGTPLAILLIVLGVIVAWASSIFLYAIGAAIEDINDIRNIVLDIYSEQRDKNVSGSVPVYYDSKN